ncbi:hypothetical protein [Streptomyces sp. NPDC094458]|uniref:hypothetical protein n=1 Tax=unclassified Streptomyces TaxID=2593676 RepID=UPI0033261E4F|nr:hypothetical protein OG414_00575 [Streptomyces sp. NBC_01174]
MNTRHNTSSGAALFIASPMIHCACNELSAPSSRTASARAASVASNTPNAT